MFEINGSHIAKLNDSDLRTLVARLCEAELRRSGLPLSAVTAGGNQDASDGGLDVRIDLPASTAISGFIPRPATGFQVKVPDMPRSAILKEMRPRGVVRPVIRDLASVSGAYIIVSAKGSTADSALRARNAAMRAALVKTPNASALVTDFYDQSRLATWVRYHPGMVAWVRERIGQPIPGWRPYANWANSSEGIEAEYLIDGKSRIQDWRTKKDTSSSVEDGIKRIREVLAKPKGVVRLVGLSGMGKTRLVQALFDKRVGTNALDSALVVYTDLADQPDPTPRDLVRRLVQNRQRVIVVVDNCPPETHQALARICSEPECVLSLISIEYDIRDDDPEETEVFRLEPASDDIIEHLLELQAPHLSHVDCRLITEFSSGNAKIAIALAHTVKRGENVGNLSNNELFNRLFHQRQPQDEGLLRAAEACALVYSFNGEPDGKDAELPFLAELAGLSVEQLYRCISELRERGLIQRRAHWKALLPQALANRLAKQALERMAATRIESLFQKRSSPRLMTSFSRRLGYLHDSEGAQRIVRTWLSSGGLLCELHTLNDLNMTMLRNIAPVVPEALLDAIERTASGENRDEFVDVANRARHNWTSLLRSIAFDAQLFSRAAQMLTRFVIVEPKDHKNNSARDKFKSLFRLHLSGTHAPIGKRLQVIGELVQSDDERRQTCGMEALNELLEGEDFSSSYGFEFGARPRDYGWVPVTRDDVIAWYNEAIAYAQELAILDTPLSDKARFLLADKFEGIWTKTGATDALESMARAVAAQSYWPEGWIAVRNTIRQRAADMPPENASRLRVIEEVLRPTNLLQKARAYVFSEPWGSLDIARSEQDDIGGDEVSAFDRAAAITKELGSEISRNVDVLEALLSDLVKKHGDVSRVWAFGEGLAEGAVSPVEMWSRLVYALASAPESERSVQALRSFLYVTAMRSPEIANNILDAAVGDPILGPWFPVLQTAIPIEERGVQRLESSIRLGLASSWLYSNLSYGPSSDSLPSVDLRRLLIGISMLPNGYDVAVQVLSMRLHSTRNSKSQIDNELAFCGRDLIRKYDFELSDHSRGYRLSELVDVCFVGANAVEDSIELCRKVKAAVKEYRLYPVTNWHLFKSIFRTQPLVALDEFVGDEPITIRLAIEEIDVDGRNPLSVVPDDILIAWAQVDPPKRFLNLATVVSAFKKDGGRGTLVWTSIALKMLDLAPDRLAVLTKFGSGLRPRGWSGSLADTIESRRTLPQAFFEDSDPRVAAWARERDAEMALWAEKERAGERRTDESFE